MVRVTVGIPTWNRAELLRGAIASVLAQTLDDLELFVFDNASTDHTPELVASFDDPRVHYVRNETNLGNQPNMTMALRSGTAPFVNLLLDDQELLPTCLERRVSFLEEHPDVVFVHSSFVDVDVDGNVVEACTNWAGLGADTVESSRTFIERSMLMGGRVHLGSFTARREVVADEGFFKEDLPLDDHPLFLRMARRGNVGFVAEPLDVRRIVPGVSSDTGYLVYQDGRYLPTLWLARESKQVKLRFIESYASDPADARRLRALARRGTRELQARVLARTHPGFRPPRQAFKHLVAATRTEPSLLLEPRLVRVLLPGLNRLQRRRRHLANRTRW